MLIDWFTVGAQLLNFLILVWLMQRFLYRPVLAAIAGREQRIAGQLADADRRQHEAAQLGAGLAAKTAELDRQRAALLADAVAAAQAERQRLLDQGRAADAALRQRNDAAMRAEQQRLCGAVTAQAGEEVLAVARRALAELADDTMEAGMVRLFLRRLAALDAAARAQLGAALAAAPASAVLRSALPLDADQQALAADVDDRRMRQTREPRQQVVRHVGAGARRDVVEDHGHRAGARDRRKMSQDPAPVGAVVIRGYREHAVDAELARHTAAHKGPAHGRRVGLELRQLTRVFRW